MSDTFSDFYSRLDRIDRIRGRRSRFGRRSTRIDRNGCLVISSRRRSMFRGRIPWTGLIMIACVSFGFKAALLVNMGTEGYQERLNGVETSTTLGKFNMWTLQADPISLFVADFINQLR